jgi:hypothetical protein
MMTMAYCVYRQDDVLLSLAKVVAEILRGLL